MIPQLYPVHVTRDLLGSAHELATTAIDRAKAHQPEFDHYPYEQLTVAVIRMLVNGELGNGLILTRLAREAIANRNRFGKQFDPASRRFTDLVVRYIYVLSRRQVLYEEMQSMPVKVSRDNMSLGADQVSGVSRSLHLLVSAIAGADQHCPNHVRAFTTCTQDDHSCARADPQRIARFERELGTTLPGTLAENLSSVLDGAVRADSPEAGSSPYLVISGLAAGPPEQARQGHARMLFPGLDEDAVEAVRRARRRGMLSCGSLSGHAADDEAGRELKIDRGFRKVQLTDLPRAQQLNVRRPFEVEYLWSHERRQLVRCDLAAGAERADFWRLVNFKDEDDRRNAIAIVERHGNTTWTRACLQRWADACGAGKLRAQDQRIRDGCVDLLVAANAAVVAAERLRRERSQ